MLAGELNNIATWTAEIAYEQAKLNLIQAQQNRFSDTAALYQALGGGWWNAGQKTASTDQPGTNPQ